MNTAQRHAAFRRMLLALWAMGTCILVFVIMLLVYTMIEQGQSPLALANQIRPQPATDHSAEPAPRQRMKEVKLFFAAPDGSRLAPETRSIEFGDSTVENCRQALDALIQGPSTHDAFAPILPADTKLRAVYALDNGELVVDFSQSQLVQQKALSSATSEALLVYGIVNTLTQPGIQGASGAAVKAVRFLFEGFAPQEAFPAHLDLSSPVTPDPSWNDPSGAPAAEPAAKGDARASS